MEKFAEDVAEKVRFHHVFVWSESNPLFLSEIPATLICRVSELS